MSRLNKLSLSVMTNFLTQGVTMILALFALPVYFRYLGDAGYGVYSFLIVLINYLSFLDLGLNAGAIRFVAEAYSAGDYEKVKKVIGTISRVYLVTATAGSFLLLFSADFIAHHFLNQIPVSLLPETVTFFQLGAIAFFLNMYSIFLGGLQTAIQKQYLSNSIRFTGDGLRLVTGMILLISGQGLVSIILSNILISLLVILTLFLSAKRELPSFSLFRPFDKAVFKELFSYSAIVMAGSVVAIVGAQANQFIIAWLLPVAMIAFYSGAFDTTTKLFLVPKNLMTPLFPLWLEMRVKNESGKIELLLFKALKFTGLSILIVSVPLFLDTESLLSLWVSPAFSDGASAPFKLLLPGVVISSLGYALIPLAYVFDLQKKALYFQITQAILNIILCFSLIPVLGVAGAALAFTLTQLLVLPVMGYFIFKESIGFMQIQVFGWDLIRLAGIGLFGALVFYLSSLFQFTGWMGIFIRFSLTISASILASWFWALDSTDKGFIRKYTPVKFLPES